MPRAKKSDQLEIHVFHPANLKVNDLNTVLTGKPGTSSLQRGVCYIYSYIIKKSLGVEAGEFGDAFIQVHSDYLRTFLSNDYNKVIDLLLAANYIERRDWDEDGEVTEKTKNGFYKMPSQGGMCKSFRIPAHLYGEDKKFLRLKEVIAKREKNKFNSVNYRVTGIEEENREFVRSMMLNVIVVDTPESRKAIEALWAENRVRATGDAFLDIFNKSPFNETVVDFFGYRVHGQVVSTPKRIRPFMRFVQDPMSPLAEIDIINSQPAILASINAELIERFAPECKEAAPLFAEVAKDDNYLYFQHLCFTNEIYEAIADRFNEMYGEYLFKPMDRAGAKPVFYTGSFSNYVLMEAADLRKQEAKLNDALLYGDADEKIEKLTEYVHTIRCYRVFKDMFPSLHNLFTKIKALDWSKFNPGKPHSNNCLLAQRIESGLVYTVLVKALRKAGIEQVVTIHDAIFLRVQDEPKARDIITKEFAKLGLKLNLKAK